MKKNHYAAASLADVSLFKAHFFSIGLPSNLSIFIQNRDTFVNGNTSNRTPYTQHELQNVPNKSQ